MAFNTNLIGQVTGDQQSILILGTLCNLIAPILRVHPRITFNPARPTTTNIPIHSLSTQAIKSIQANRRRRFTIVIRIHSLCTLATNSIQANPPPNTVVTKDRVFTIVHNNTQARM